MRSDKLLESLILVLETAQTQLNNRDLMNMLEDCKQIVEKLFGKAFILENDTWPDIRFTSIGRNKFGECRVQYIDGRPSEILSTQINISKVLQNFDKDKVRDTVMHEFLHSLKCCSGSGHEGKWKEMSDIINRQTDYDVTPNAEGQDVKDFNDIYDNKHKTVYHVICNNCGQEFKYYTSNAQIVKHPDYYKHHCPDGTVGTLRVEIEKR